MRYGMAPPDPLHLVGHRCTISSPVRRASSSPPCGRRPWVLLVDDDAQNRRLQGWKHKWGLDRRQGLGQAHRSAVVTI
jgi:hypothetical protein